MKLTPYWLDTATPSGDYRANPLPERADVAIVGAGFTGLSAALEAAKHGAKVVVLDEHTVGWGASGRNGGMATTGLAIGLGKAIKRYGRSQALEMFSEYNRAIDTIEELVKEHSIECDFRRSGKLTLAMNAKQVGQMRKTQQTLADLADYPVHVLDKEDIHSEIGSDFYAGGMVDPQGAGVHVGRFAHGLAEASAKAGVTLCENARVTQLTRPPGGGHEVRTTRGAVHADRVLVATSGYTGALTPWLRRRTIPVGSFIIVTEPLPLETAQRILPRDRQASDNKMLTYYFRITPDNRLLFGGRARFALSSPDSDLKSAEILKQAMSTVFPYLASAHRLHLGRPGGPDHGPDGPRRGARRHPLLARLQRPRGPDGHLHGQADGPVDGGQAVTQPLGTPSLPRGPRPRRAAVVPPDHRWLRQARRPYQPIEDSPDVRREKRQIDDLRAESPTAVRTSLAGPDARRRPHRRRLANRGPHPAGDRPRGRSPAGLRR